MIIRYNNLTLVGFEKNPLIIDSDDENGKYQQKDNIFILCFKMIYVI